MCQGDDKLYLGTQHESKDWQRATSAVNTVINQKNECSLLICSAECHIFDNVQSVPLVCHGWLANNNFQLSTLGSCVSYKYSTSKEIKQVWIFRERWAFVIWDSNMFQVKLITKAWLCCPGNSVYMCVCVCIDG